MSQPRTFRRALLGLLLLVPAVAAVAAAPERPPAAPIEDARGVIVSCWGWGWEWSKPQMKELMETLPDVGANWLAIHPYAHVSRETGELRWSEEKPIEHVQRPIRWAKELGLRIMIKPHISYWGEFAWRGEIDWGEEEKWRRFRESYQGWIRHLAKICEQEGADLFVIGTELRMSEGMDDWWSSVIRDVRASYHGPITYASNHDDYARLRWWSQLDYIGVHAYFPLTSQPDPSESALRRAWRTRAKELERFSRKVGRPVILAEVGYTNIATAAARPWEYHRGAGPTDVQERCLRAALETARESDAIVGAFVWKWFPTTSEQGPGDFTVQTTEFKSLLREVWKTPVTTPEPASVPGP